MKDKEQNMKKSTGEESGGGMRVRFAMAMTKIREMITISRTKEGRALLVSKTKGAVTFAKDKIAAVWQSGIKGKIALCAFTLLVLWLCVPSCRREADSGTAVFEKHVSEQQSPTRSVMFPNSSPQHGRSDSRNCVTRTISGLKAPCLRV